MNIKVQYWFVLFVVLALAVVFGFKHESQEDGGVLKGVVLPSVFQGEPAVNFDNLLGKRYVVNIFASWCKSCAAEHKFWFSVADRVDIYGVSYVDTPEKIIKWLKKNGNPYKAVGADYAGILGKFLKINGVPETVVVDEKGKIIAHVTGVMTERTWNGIIKPMLDLN